MPPASAPTISTGVGDVSSYSVLFSPDAASSLASPSVELEVHWDPQTIRSQLRMAVAVLSHRCLKLSAKWASEQLVGLTDSNSGATTRKESFWNSSSSTGNLTSNEWIKDMADLHDRELFSKSLFELGEYLHAAAVLSEPNDDVTKMSQPIPDLTSFGIYLRSYALYMAGERRKEQDHLELKR